MEISRDVLEKLVLEADQELSKLGLAIAQRPVSAVIYVGNKLHIPVPITKPIEGLHVEANKYWEVTKFVYDWFDRRYGAKTKMDFSTGRMAVLINEDVFVFRLPLIMGRAYFCASRQHGKKGNTVSRGAQMFNVIDLIEDIPDGLRDTLTDDQLANLLALYMVGIHSIQQLLEHGGHELIDAALSDIDLSVNCLCRNTTVFGQSKWLSLQAIEKVLKFAIEKKGHGFSKTHNLNKLLTEAISAGYTLDIEGHLDAIACTPKIRYGEESCTKHEAIHAHHSVLMASHKIMQCLV